MQKEAREAGVVQGRSGMGGVQGGVMPVAINTADMNEKGGQLDQGPRVKKVLFFKGPRDKWLRLGLRNKGREV